VVTLLIGDVLAYGESADCVRCVYVVRDGSTTFYVGKTTRGGANRLREHCGGGERPRISRLGRVILRNAPESDMWEVDLMSVEDCEPFIRLHYPVLRRRDLDLAEGAMIVELRPHLNYAGNFGGTGATGVLPVGLAVRLC